MAKEAKELAQQAVRITKLREEMGRREGRRVPQPEVADAVGVTLRAYQAWEAGDSDLDPKHLKALADFHGVTADFIEYGDRLRQRDANGSAPSPFQQSQLDRIETLVTEIHVALHGDADTGVDGLADRLLRAVASPPSPTVDEPEIPPEAQQQ